MVPFVLVNPNPGGKLVNPRGKFVNPGGKFVKPGGKFVIGTKLFVNAGKLLVNVGKAFVASGGGDCVMPVLGKFVLKRGCVTGLVPKRAGPGGS